MVVWVWVWGGGGVSIVQGKVKNKQHCIRTLPRGGMYWEIHPPRPERSPEGEARGES